MKYLDGKTLASFIKKRQAQEVSNMSQKPHLIIIRDSENPVIAKYVHLKIKYGEDIGVLAEEVYAKTEEELKNTILQANSDPSVNGIILQLPILKKELTDEITALIAPEKDVDGLSQNGKFDSATATAINWLLAGYDIDLSHKKIAIVGRGKLVGAPLFKMWKNSNYDVTMFHRGSNLADLSNYDVIVTATGVPSLITSEMVKPAAVIVDAGTASEKGILLGDVSEEVRNRTDLTAITPKVGGVGPLTVTCLFEHVIQATKNALD